MKVDEKGSVYQTSRLAYLHNYILVGIIFATIILILPYLDVMKNIVHFTIFFGLLTVASGLSEEAEWERVFRKYIVTNNEIVKTDGFIRKRRWVLPMQSVADVRVDKGVVGRIFDFGNVIVAGFKEEIVFKGIKNPEEIQRIIQSKINIQRETMIKKFGKQK